MSTIADKLNYLNDTKEAIRTAINNKGVEVTELDTFRSYADKIGQISGGGGNGGSIEFESYDFDNSSITYQGYFNIKKLSLESIVSTNSSARGIFGKYNTSITSTSLSFALMNALTEVQINDLTSVTDARQMFYNNTTITTISLGGLQNVTDFRQIFYNCTALTNVLRFEGFVASLNIVNNTALTKDSLLAFINGSGTVSTTQTFAISSAQNAMLTEEEKQVMIDKGWTITIS